MVRPIDEGGCQVCNGRDELVILIKLGPQQIRLCSWCEMCLLNAMLLGYNEPEGGDPE